jgi:hypothetical protein
VIDLVEGEGTTVTPVDYKRGAMARMAQRPGADYPEEFVKFPRLISRGPIEAENTSPVRADS